MGHPSKPLSGSLFDGSKLANVVLHQLFMAAVQNPQQTNSQTAQKQLEQLFVKSENQTLDKLKAIQWNASGQSPANPSIAILLLILAARDLLWAQQLLARLVALDINLDWNQTSTNESLMGKTTPLLMLTQIIDTDKPWAKELVLKIIDQHAPLGAQHDGAKEQRITLH